MLTVLVICIGACAGALLRWQLGLWGNATAGMPMGTLPVRLRVLKVSLHHRRSMWRRCCLL